MAIIEFIIESLINHYFLVSIVAGFLGEEAVLFLTFLQSVSGIRLEVILLFAPIGLILIDLIYYLLGRIKFLKKITDEIKNIEMQKGVLPRIIRFSNRRPLFAMIITKFIYGTRSGLIVYLSSQGMSFRRFMVYNIVAIELWAFTTIPVAWLFGKWWGSAGLDVLENFFLVVALALGFVVALDTLIRFVYNKLRKSKEINLK